MTENFELEKGVAQMSITEAVYNCGHCGFEGHCYGVPFVSGSSGGVSAPWCPRCGINDKLVPVIPQNSENSGTGEHLSQHSNRAEQKDICLECKGSGSKIIHNQFQVKCDICRGTGRRRHCP